MCNLCSSINRADDLYLGIFQLQQVNWQETQRGYVAGILTTQRVLMVSADLDILASSSTKFDKGLPSISLFRITLLLGPYQWYIDIFLSLIRITELETSLLSFFIPAFSSMFSYKLVWQDQCVLFEHLTYVHYRSLLWVGPALLFSTATGISVLGWDGKVRTILSISITNSGK